MLGRRTKLIYKKVINIAFPIILGSIAQNVISITDTAFLGHVGQVELGASALAGVFYLAFIMLAFGFGTGAQIIIARRLGENELKKIGRVWEHAFYFLMVLAVGVFILIKFFAPSFLSYAMESKEVLSASIDYLGIRAFGVFFAFINIVFRAFYVGIGRTLVITITTIVMAVVNIFFDYVLIFGKMGFPEMGIEGAALASLLAEIVTTIFVIVYTRVRIPYRAFGMFRFVKFQLKVFRRIFKIASPMMLTNFISLSIWFFFFLIIENLGEVELAVSQIVRSTYIIFLLPIWGFSSATSTLVSYYLGRQRVPMVWELCKKIALFASFSVLGVIAVFFIGPEWLLKFFSDDMILIDKAHEVMRMMAWAACFLALGFVFFSAVSGTGATRMALLIEIAALSIYLFYAWSMANRWDGTLAQVWSAEYVYGFFLGGFSIIYLLTGRWKTLKV